MTEFNLFSFLIGAGAGLVVGVLLTLLTHKLRSGSASPVAVKKEMDEYQQKVEAHFDQTSEKFRAMAEQYKDLYQHLSVGATSLCRPEHVVSGLSDDSNPLQSLPPKKGVSEIEKTVAKTSQNKTASKADAKRKANSEPINKGPAADHKDHSESGGSDSSSKEEATSAKASKPTEKSNSGSKSKRS